MEFEIGLKDFQDILKALRKDGHISDDSTAEVLTRTISNDKVQFGRKHHNGLLIHNEADVRQEGSTAFMLGDIYTAITKLKGTKTTRCKIKWVDNLLNIEVEDRTFKDIPTYNPERLIKWFDNHLPPEPFIKMDASELKDTLDRVLICIDPMHLSDSLKNILLKIDKEYLTMTGSNGVKFNEVVKTHNGWSGPYVEMIVSFYAGKLLKNLFKKGTIELSTLKRNIYFKLDTILVVGDLKTNIFYPDYAALFPHHELDNTNSFKLPIAKLYEMASFISMTADPEDNFRLTINAENDLVIFRNVISNTKHRTDDIKGIIDLDVNAKFLTELSKTMNGEAVEVKYQNDGKYITFHPDEANQRALLTIVRRKE
jgi:DNA polymerase III sliding clamp (beta) subunit (PCNA family)